MPIKLLNRPLIWCKTLGIKNQVFNWIFGKNFWSSPKKIARPDTSSYLNETKPNLSWLPAHTHTAEAAVGSQLKWTNQRVSISSLVLSKKWTSEISFRRKEEGSKIEKIDSKEECSRTKEECSDPEKNVPTQRRMFWLQGRMFQP